MDEPAGIYVHVPFCRARCAYCDFAVVVGKDGLADAWLDGVLRELERRADGVAGPVTTVHLGGGTPSRLAPRLVADLLAGIDRRVGIAAGAEIALEANPEDVTRERLAGWRAAGVTRLVVGVQSTAERGIRALGRRAPAGEGPRALRLARAAGFRSLGADLVIGWAGQEDRELDADLDLVIGEGADHVSCYMLEVDGDAPLARRIRRGERPGPDPDRAADLYWRAADRLEAAGLPAYEISNFARPGHESRHNLRYWTDAPYLGLGPAAASYLAGERWTNPRGLADWLAMLRGAAPAPPPEPYDPDRRVGEALVFGLRRIAGVDLARLAARHGADPVERRRPVLAGAAREGLLVLSGNDARLTRRGRLVADEVFVDLL